MGFEKNDLQRLCGEFQEEFVDAMTSCIDFENEGWKKRYHKKKSLKWRKK